ncbi:MAG: M48 family metallopeptidase [Firmicutes bacterium]|nr:M48 family metallopeptidase [Bacillota bacterium]
MNNSFHGIPVQIIRSKRRTISIELKPVGIVVRAPKGMSEADIMGFLEKKGSWIDKHWSQIQERKEQAQALDPFTQAEIRELAEKALKVIPERVKHYAPLVGVDYGRITIRNQKTRWGSCSSQGNLNFNCLLMLFPDEVIDSVVVHELCHRKHMNHSAKFYKEVERVFPEYRKWHQWLNENGKV